MKELYLLTTDPKKPMSFEKAIAESSKHFEVSKEDIQHEYLLLLKEIIKIENNRQLTSQSSSPVDKAPLINLEKFRANNVKTQTTNHENVGKYGI